MEKPIRMKEQQPAVMQAVRSGHEFLLGLTNYDSLHGDWLELAESLENQGDQEAVAEVKGRLRGIAKWRDDQTE